MQAAYAAGNVGAVQVFRQRHRPLGDLGVGGLLFLGQVEPRLVAGGVAVEGVEVGPQRVAQLLDTVAVGGEQARAVTVGSSEDARGVQRSQPTLSGCFQQHHGVGVACACVACAFVVEADEGGGAVARQSSLRSAQQQARQSGQLRLTRRRDEVSGGGDDEGVALELGGVNLPEVVIGGVDVGVGPIGERDARNADAPVVEHQVVGGIVEGNGLGAVGFLGAERGEHGAGEVAGVCAGAQGDGGVAQANRLQDAFDHVVQKAGAGEGRAAHELDALAGALLGADHVLVEVDQNALGLLGVVAEVAIGSADFIYPPEADVTPGAGEFALLDQPHQRAGNLEHAGDAGTVVVGGGFLFLQVGGEDNGLVADFGAANPAFDDGLGLLAEFNFDFDADAERLVVFLRGGQARAQALAFARGQNPSEGAFLAVVGARADTLPGQLVGEAGSAAPVGDHAQRAALPHRLSLYSPRAAGGEHDLAFDLLAFVVGVAGAAADVNEFGGDVSGAAAGGDAEGSFADIAQLHFVGFNHPDLARAQVPSARTGLHPENLDVFKPKFAGLVGHPLGLAAKVVRAAVGGVVEGELAEVVEGDVAGEFILQRLPDLGRNHGRTLRLRRWRREAEKQSQERNNPRHAKPHWHLPNWRFAQR